MNKLIAPFLKYLDEQKLIDFDLMCTEDFESDDILFDRNYDPENDQAHIHGMNLQKYAYLAKYFGLDFPYKHSILLEGPFSSSLADDFVHIVQNRKELYDSITSNLPESFRSQKFLGFVKDKDALWLEIAASIIMWNEDGIETKDELVKFMVRVNPGLEQEYATRVLEELKPFDMLKLKITS